MKIALVSPYDWSYPGGVRDHIRHLAAELRAREHNVRILTPATGAEARKVEYGTYKLSWAASLKVNGSVARPSLSPQVHSTLRQVLKREHFDVVHLHEPMVSGLPIAVLRMRDEIDAVYVGTFHAWARHGLTSTPEWAYMSTKPLLQRYIKRLDGRIAVSPAAAEFISRFFPSDYRIIPNGVDVERFAHAQPLPQFADGRPNVVFLGRIEQRKGLRYLLSAIPAIREQCPTARFLIGGDGPLRADYEAYVMRNGWQDVHFLGRVSDDDLPALYASATVMCAPSTGGESQGIVLLEAMSAGCAVVASDIPGYRTVIEDAINGLLVKPRDPEHIAWAITYVLLDPERRRHLAEAARVRAQEYAWDRVAREIESYYLEVIAAPRSTRRPPMRQISGGIAAHVGE